MEVTYEWLYENRVVVCRYKGDSDGDFVAASQALLVEQITAFSHDVHIVLDLSGLTRWETNVRRVRNMMSGKAAPNTASVVILSSSPVLRFIMDVALQLVVSHLPIHFAADIEAALTYIRNHDPSLNDLPMHPAAIPHDTPSSRRDESAAAF